jgi:3-oxoacyl-[acyl-carrier protein] reductase
MDLELTGKVALVTGSYRGTGLAIAARLGAEGARVMVHGFTPEQAHAACAELGTGIAVSGDITTDGGAQALVDACRSHAPVDILVNNYGAAAAGRWDTTTSADWIDQYQRNVLSAQRLIQHFLPDMRQRGWGRIINLGTVGSTRPNARMPHYYAAKAALANLTVGLAREVAGTGIRVNLVSPGLILTREVQQQYLERGRREGWGERWEEIEPHVARDVPIGRIVRREEVAALVAFLASPVADAIHGQNVRIDGGGLGVVS